MVGTLAAIALVASTSVAYVFANQNADKARRIDAAAGDLLFSASVRLEELSIPESHYFFEEAPMSFKHRYLYTMQWAARDELRAYGRLVGMEQDARPIENLLGSYNSYLNTIDQHGYPDIVSALHAVARATRDDFAAMTNLLRDASRDLDAAKIAEANRIAREGDAAQFFDNH